MRFFWSQQIMITTNENNLLFICSAARQRNNFEVQRRNCKSREGKRRKYQFDHFRISVIIVQAFPIHTQAQIKSSMYIIQLGCK